LGNCIDRNISIPEISPAGRLVTGIGESAFADWNSIVTVRIPDSVTSIGISAFSNCTRLTDVIISDNVSSIGKYAFNNCIALVNANIPSNLTTIEYSTFYNCTSLSSIVIPSSVTIIGSKSFANCSSIKNLNIPDTVLEIGSGAFEGCSSLESISIPFTGRSADITGYQSHFGFIFGYQDYYRELDANKYGYHIYEMTPSYSYRYYSFKIPASLKHVTVTNSDTIKSQVFMRCATIESVAFLGNVTRFEKQAVYGCENLTTVFLPKTVTYIGDSAFSFSSNVKDVYYTGTEEEYLSINIVSPSTNGNLRYCTVHYNYVVEK
jgi:hypothetical protein